MTDIQTGPASGLTPDARVSIDQIADLPAWARRLAEQPLDADPRHRAAFHQAKIDLLARISNPDPHHTMEGGV